MRSASLPALDDADVHLEVHRLTLANGDLVTDDLADTVFVELLGVHSFTIGHLPVICCSNRRLFE